MKNVLYIGNKLESKASNLSAIHTLGLLLENEGYAMHYSSSKKNILLRLIDMARTSLNVNGSMTAGIVTSRLLKIPVVEGEGEGVQKAI